MDQLSLLTGRVALAVVGFTVLVAMPPVHAAGPVASGEIQTEERSVTPSSESPLACVLGALTTGERARQMELWGFVKGSVLDVSETETGFAFQFAPSMERLMELAELVTIESRCCPFVRFDIGLSEEGGPLTLRLSGREGVKELLASLLEL